MLAPHCERITPQESSSAPIARGRSSTRWRATSSCSSGGTALLFYRDMVGQNSHMPTIMALDDVHPQTFSIMPDVNGAPIFGVNDSDETIYAS
nr:DUF2252 family protein [uncultured Jannaschia sp.]